MTDNPKKTTPPKAATDGGKPRAAAEPSPTITISGTGSVISPLSTISEYLRGASSITIGSPTPTGILRLSQPGGLLVSEGDQEQLRALETEIGKLRSDLSAKTRALQAEQTNAAEHKRREDDLKVTLSKLEKKEQLAFLLDRVEADAARALLAPESRLPGEFLASEPRPLFAMSVDIRRSTDLMLKARTPQQFATFITTLCKELMEIVTSCHGVVDKFTGDGILCFFPEFFSGKDAGFYALAAADACHRAFANHYRAHRSSFQSVLSDTGLGIGIDYGECHVVQVAGGLTIVGVPVVYACRLGGAPAGTTLLNQPAFEVISERHGAVVLLNESSIEIKHEGKLVAYSAALSRTSRYRPAPPAWMDLAAATQKDDGGGA